MGNDRFARGPARTHVSGTDRTAESSARRVPHNSENAPQEIPRGNMRACRNMAAGTLGWESEMRTPRPSLEWDLWSRTRSREAS
jgi:hypothetical protein